MRPVVIALLVVLGACAHTLKASDGGTCTVKRGMALAEVRDRCGAPDHQGDRDDLKVRVGEVIAHSLGQGAEGRACPGLVETYGDRYVIYDCANNVDEVRAAR